MHKNGRWRLIQAKLNKHKSLHFRKKTNKIVLAPLCFNNATVVKHITV